jgi:hypothetical protein
MGKGNGIREWRQQFPSRLFDHRLGDGRRGGHWYTATDQSFKNALMDEVEKLWHTIEHAVRLRPSDRHATAPGYG